MVPSFSTIYFLPSVGTFNALSIYSRSYCCCWLQLSALHISFSKRMKVYAVRFFLFYSIFLFFFFWLIYASVVARLHCCIVVVTIIWSPWLLPFTLHYINQMPMLLLQVLLYLLFLLTLSLRFGCYCCCCCLFCCFNQQFTQSAQVA